MGEVVRAYAYGFAIPRAASGFTSGQWEISERFMIEDLAKSGLVPEDMLAFPMVMGLPRGADAAYAFPYYGLDGKPLVSKETGVAGRMHRIRGRPSERLSREELRKFSKYTQPSREQIGDAATMPYIHPSWWDADDGMARYIVEGEKKAVAFHKRTGAAVIAIAGCHNWHHPDPNEAGMLHPAIVDALQDMKVGEVVIIPDGDIRRQQVNRAYTGFKRALEGISVRSSIINFAAQSPDKLDDWLVANPKAGIREVEHMELFDEGDLLENRADLVRRYDLQHRADRAGAVIEILPTNHNCLTLFRKHPYYQGSFRLNEDTMRVEGDYDEDNMVTMTTSELEYNFGMPRAARSTVRACIGVVAEERTYSPICDWLNGLEWDGEKRLARWMAQYLGCEDSAYTRELGVKCIVAACARKIYPGCEVDFMTILKGRQGIGKSSVIRMLFGKNNVLEYVRGNAEGKDAVMQMVECWCVSDEEMGMHSRSEMNTIKALITRRTDVWRPPYAASTKQKPRTFVLWGSTNSAEFLTKDSSGYRRYAVVEVEKVDFDGVARAREQLFAEAMEILRSKRVDYSNIKGTSEVAERYVTEDLFAAQVDNAISAWKKGQGKDRQFKNGDRQCWALRLLEISTAMGMDSNRVSTEVQGRRVSDSLRMLGWVNVGRRRMFGKEGPLWVKPVEDGE